MLEGPGPYPRRRLDLTTRLFQGNLHIKYLIIASLGFFFFCLNCFFLCAICNHFPKNDSSLNVQLSVIESVYLCDDFHRINLKILGTSFEGLKNRVLIL